MIIRHFTICSTCNHAHTLRIQVGHEKYQEHVFNCADCQEEMKVGMTCFPELASVEIREIDNSERGFEEGTIINLSPEFPIPPSDLHRDLAFPSIEYTKTIIKAQVSLGIRPLQFKSHESLLEFHSKHSSSSENWTALKKAWSLSDRGRGELSAQYLKKYKSSGFDGPYELNHVLFDFAGKLLMPGQYSLFERAAEYTRTVSKKHSDNYHEFREYYLKNLQKDNLSRYYELFSEYFKCYDDFSQTLSLIQHNTDLPKDFETSSYSFNKTKLFYGNAFEALTSNITVLACIYNLSTGRKYNKFKEMDLKKYMTTNKANRANPFSEVDALYSIAKCLDSTLRNGSHHGSIKLIDNGKRIQYRSGGTGGIKIISHRKYVNRCNRIMLSMCALLSLELIIAF